MSTRLSRRRLLQGAGLTAFGVASFGVLPLFDTPSRQQSPTKCRVTDRSAADKRLVVSNWPDYIDEDSKHQLSTWHQFEKKYGVNVSYTADVNDNVEFFAKVVNQLGSCTDTKRDLFVLTDWMASRMIQMGWLQPMDRAKVPNLHANIISSLRSPGWDPQRTYSAPWQSGFTGIGYNSKYLDKPPRTIKELLTRPDLKGKISVLTEMRDTMGLVMLSEGIDPEHFTDAQWKHSIDVLREAKNRGQIRAFQGNEYVDDLASGNILACTAWSGDVAAAADPHMKFLVPEDGMMIWSDNMLIPNMTPHLSLAEEWVNWYYDPKIAAQLADYNYYISPVQGIEPYLHDLDPSIFKNPDLLNLIIPDEGYLKQTHLFMALKEYQIRDYEGDFADVSGV